MTERILLKVLMVLHFSLCFFLWLCALYLGYTAAIVPGVLWLLFSIVPTVKFLAS